MAFPTLVAKKLSNYLSILKKEGLNYIVGSSRGGVSMQHCKVTLTGGATHTFTFAGAGLSDMADANYSISLDGEGTNRPKVDESTITVAGFDILGGDVGGADVAHVIVAGRLKGQSAHS